MKIDPAMWADSELKLWLEKVSSLFIFASVRDFLHHTDDSQRGLMPDKKATREELLERVRANMRPPPRT